MSQTFFSKLDTYEKNNRLQQLAGGTAKVTIWIKGQKIKDHVLVLSFDKDRSELLLDTSKNLFALDTEVLCSFESRGMSFFSQAKFKKSISDQAVLHFHTDLFKSERRTSFRLLTYPIYEVWATFELGERYESNVVNLRGKNSAQTGLFKNFLQLVEDGGSKEGKLQIRVQDLSATGMSIHISALEAEHFEKDKVFTNVTLSFADESVEIPEVKVMYLVDYISADKNLKKFKAGIHFPKLPAKVDDFLGRKINKLLREVDSNKDFENFLK
jgi:hypothetical protein